MRTGTRASLLLVACLIVALAGQGIADATAPRGASKETGESVGRAGYAVLGGLRSLAAVLLFDRLEPQLHEYYKKVPLDRQTFTVPTLRLVTLLDGHLEQPYYVLPWVLAHNGRTADAVAIAREGVANNPRSGGLHVALGQTLLFYEKYDPAAIAAAVDPALRSDATWYELSSKSQDLTTAAHIYDRLGMPAKAARARALSAEVDEILKSQGETSTPTDDHADESGEGAPGTSPGGR